VSRPLVSIVINTLNRAESLRRALLAIGRVAYPEFEVIVVTGPCEDHTDEVLMHFPFVKVARCDVPNHSVSRNIGIREAAGELVAFIDDDSVPDPWWLDDIVPAFDDPEVAGAGGPVYDFDGRMFARYSISDVHGDAESRLDQMRLSRLLAAPRSEKIVYPIGTNAVFRRDCLLDIGGWDEAFAYYLDETDVSRRLVDNGWVIEAVERGFVQHFRDSSDRRTEHRVTRDLYQVLNSRIYFALRHARPRVGITTVMSRYEQTVEGFRAERQHWAGQGLLDPVDLDRFEHDAMRAVDDALERVLLPPQTRSRDWLDECRPAFRPFERDLPRPRFHICIVSHEYPPKQLNGVGRYSHQLALSLAGRGHVVRVITEGSGQDGVSYEDDVWVHRVVPVPAARPPDFDPPAWLWDFSTRVLQEVRQIDAGHRVDVVQMSNWNSEGIAVIEDGGFRTVVGMHTPIATIARIEPSLALLDAEVRRFMALERRTCSRADYFVAAGPAGIGQVESEYGIQVPRERLRLIPHGIVDSRSADALAAAADSVNVLFVGRLEARKGADTLLHAISRVLPAVPNAAFTLIGNDTIRNHAGRTYREEFELYTGPTLRDGRVFFLGIVGEDDLARYYAGCDVFVAPSRHESFGLILLEAMREGKPVIAADAGGMREIVEHEGNGLLVPPDDAEALAAAIERLVRSPGDRTRFGRRSRELFLERFTAERMAESYEEYYGFLVESGSGRQR
jgi:glycogen synthase